LATTTFAATLEESAADRGASLCSPPLGGSTAMFRYATNKQDIIRDWAER